jgi:hypothetical protein
MSPPAGSARGGSLAIAVAVGATLAGLALAGAAPVPVVGPGLGIENLREYWGATPGVPDPVGPLAVAALGVVALVLASRATMDRRLWLALAAATAIAAIWVAPAATPDAVLVPLVLLAAAAWPLDVADEATVDSAEAAP